jgi:hypothetical protein
VSFHSVPLPDGTRGFLVRRSDDCLAAAIATTIQDPDVPDLRIDARLHAGMRPEEVDRVVRVELDAWLAGRGVRARIHDRVPVHSDRCIGVVPIEGWFQSHCLVLSRGGELLHDPAGRGVGMVSRLLGIHIWDETDVTWAMTFEVVENKSKGSF